MNENEFLNLLVEKGIDKRLLENEFTKKQILDEMCSSLPHVHEQAGKYYDTLANMITTVDNARDTFPNFSGLIINRDGSISVCYDRNNSNFFETLSIKDNQINYESSFNMISKETTKDGKAIKSTRPYSYTSAYNLDGIEEKREEHIGVPEVEINGKLISFNEPEYNSALGQLGIKWDPETITYKRNPDMITININASHDYDKTNSLGADAILDGNKKDFSSHGFIYLTRDSLLKLKQAESPEYSFGHEFLVKPDDKIAQQAWNDKVKNEIEEEKKNPDSVIGKKLIEKDRDKFLMQSLIEKSGIGTYDLKKAKEALYERENEQNQEKNDDNIR